MRRGRHRILSAIGVGCYVLAAIAGLFLLADDSGPGLLIPLWIAHGVLLVALLAKLGSGEAALFVVGASLMAVYVADTARDDLTLERRGEQVTATVVKQWREPTRGRADGAYDYALERGDGSEVPGPALRLTSDRFDVGQTVTVIEDPEGELRPRTPGQADARGAALGSGAFALAALGAVPWAARRGAAAERRRAARERLEEQEHTLREALRTASADHDGYIELHPEQYPDVPHRRAARIAWDLGLRAEAVDNWGSWRFAETVIEEVPRDQARPEPPG